MTKLSMIHGAVLAAIVLAACDRGPAPAPAPVNAAAPAPAITTEGKRIVAANTAAAEYLRVLVPPARVALVPEQVGEYASIPFDQEGWEDVARLARYSADPILAANADLVVVHAWQEPETAALLRDRGVPVMQLSSANGWEDVASNLRALGVVLHCEKAAEKAILRRGDVVARLAREAAKRPKLRALVYSNDGSGGFAAAKHTTADAVLRIAGVVNAAAEAGLEGHAQVDFDRLLVLDPDLLVLAAPSKGAEKSVTLSVLESASVAAGLRALKEQRIVLLPDALLSSDSPTMVDAADLLVIRIDDLLAGRKQ
ncbi:MAG: ABC transporter substrate-binding protein [Planctomycetes bacterium]|nr:ABC transporter substrate-binding protein [Planctomycetota bacterium]